MLRVLKPYQLADANLISSTVAADTTAAWSVATTYGSGASVQYLNRLYQSLQAGNLAKTPGAAASAAWWLDLGPTERWAMFDGSVSTATTSADSVLEVVLSADDFIDSLAVVGAQAHTVTVIARSGATVVYSQTKTIGAGYGASWWDYFFGDRESSGSLLFDNIPPYLGAQITVTLQASGIAACGVLIVGKLHEIGTVEKGAEAGITDYSRKDTDEFGTATLLQRDFASEASYPVLVTRADMARLKALLASIRATPCLWVGDDDTETYEPLVVFGWFSDFRLVIDYFTHARMSLDIQGLT